MPAPDNDNEISTSADASVSERPKTLSPAAQRALREAEERRKSEMQVDLPVEHGGRGGADPARFGDWEINGRAIDF